MNAEHNLTNPNLRYRLITLDSGDEIAVIDHPALHVTAHIEGSTIIKDELIDAEGHAAALKRIEARRKKAH